MDAVITAAGRALAAGDPLGALTRVALRDDAPALALRGIAMAQLGDLSRARTLLRLAARAFGPKEVVSRARCVVAEAEVAFATRDLTWSARALEGARETLEARGDLLNAMHARLLAVRRLVLIGQLEEADEGIAQIDEQSLPPALETAYALIQAGIAMRRVRGGPARAAVSRAAHAAERAGIPSLAAEVDAARAMLERPVARVGVGDATRSLQLSDVEALYDSETVIVDACRLVVRGREGAVPLSSRPLLFAIARALGELWPADASRELLIARAFGSVFTDESHRARLRVEIARLRSELRSLCGIRATAGGFVLVPPLGAEVVVLLPPLEEQHATLLALLSDGESWSSSALALALSTSQRSVQRALDALASSGRITSFGRGRSRRWVTPPVPGFTTTLLLPAPLPSD